MKRIRIISKGGAGNTHIYDADTGEELTNVLALSIGFDVSMETPILVATIKFLNVEVDVEAELKEKDAE